MREFRVGLRSVPSLADHGFQDMVVLPGAFYVALARRDGARVLHNVVFHHPLILSHDDTVIQVEVSEHDGRVDYAFADAAGKEAGPAATLTCDRHAAPSANATLTPPEGTPASLEAAELYRKLRENGNQYGPAFQRVTGIWRTGEDQCIGRLAALPTGLEASVLILDAATQLLASLTLGVGKTFVLRSIERIDFAKADAPFSGTMWARAMLRPGELMGDVELFGDDGQQLVCLAGVAFTLLESVATRLVVAANFTAEPVEDALRYWSDQFGVRLDVEFAPYDQVFQQLLDRGSALRRNQDGVNVLLLALEEWAGVERHTPATLSVSAGRAAQCFGDRQRTVLPNGVEIVHLNQYETDYLYKEIFEEQTYLKNGIQLPDGATVVDIGANIGMFSLFVLSRCAEPTIYAFEPAPRVYDLLTANCAAYGARVHPLNLGVSDKAKSAPFTFYERSSVFSGFHADDGEDRAAIHAVVRNAVRDEIAAAEDVVESVVAELTADRLRHTTHECRLISVSDLIRERGIDKIDLLKIDAEKSELDILAGIEDTDWPKIAQIVIEIHDRTQEAVKQVERLLTAKGYRCVVERERPLEDSGLFNLYATRGEPAVRPLERNVRDLCIALRDVMPTTAAPLVVCVTPRTPAAAADPALQAALDEAERLLLTDAGALPHVSVISSASLMARYPVKNAHDPHSDHLAHIPYTREGYAAIGTAVFRALAGLKGPLYKVIAVDCDNTLWKGVCGEDGPLGVEVTPAHRRLQEFLIEQTKAGMLLCLCSKNSEQDVFDVLDQHPAMVLRREHLAAWRINWESKSNNLMGLARDLELGLDSFIFLDDNPVECADVRSNCPDVLALQMPVNLDQVWAFDRRHTGGAGATDEDRRRTRLYQENAQRQQFRERTGSLRDFIAGLDLRVTIADMSDADLGRVSQLTYRTNQFNFTTVRRSEPEIRAFLQRNDATCLVVRVSDRFGDYGLVGAVLYETRADRLAVDTLLLSCRVLGRGVEHAVVAELGRRALAAGKRLVELPYRPTAKNAPAREFLAGLGTPGPVFDADRLAALTYDPDAPALEAERDTPRSDRSAPAFGAAALQRIAEGPSDIAHITRAIEAHRVPEVAEDVAPVTAGSLEAALLGIWRLVLGRRVGLSDNFFEVGGTSLRAVQVIATIKKELKRDLSIVTLFECPTVSLLAARLQTPAGVT
ncbi:MAG TPA: FkbM family methyltransferase, partial [Gemmatimonadales bacterium]|nr:FkbM family methyltransferase [Gemmatimonadales bacterium]